MPVPPLFAPSVEKDDYAAGALLPADFAVSLTFASERTVVAVRGELDLVTTPAFGAFLDAAAARERCPVVIDFAGLTFIGASGIGQIARTFVGLRTQGRSLVIASPSPFIYHLLELTGFMGVMDIARRSLTESERATCEATAATVAEVRAGGVVGAVLTAALRRVVDLAATTVGLADGASVTLAVGDNLATVAASNDVIAGMDADQYSLHEGPCVSAATAGEGFYIESMASEARWPAFASRAYRRGINSVISTPLIVEGRTVGALNIYSRTPRAFAPPQGELAWRIASQAAKILEVHAAESTAVEYRARAVGGVLDRRTCRERRRISTDGGGGERRIALRDGGTGPVIRAAQIAASVLVESPVGARSD